MQVGVGSFDGQRFPTLVDAQLPTYGDPFVSAPCLVQHMTKGTATLEALTFL